MYLSLQVALLPGQAPQHLHKVSQSELTDSLETLLALSFWKLYFHFLSKAFHPLLLLLTVLNLDFISPSLSSLYFSSSLVMWSLREWLGSGNFDYVILTCSSSGPQRATKRSFWFFHHLLSTITLALLYFKKNICLALLPCSPQKTWQCGLKQPSR